MEEQTNNQPVIYLQGGFGWTATSTENVSVVVCPESFIEAIEAERNNAIINSYNVMSTCVNALEVIKDFDKELLGRELKKKFNQIEQNAINIAHEVITGLSEQEED